MATPETSKSTTAPVQTPPVPQGPPSDLIQLDSINADWTRNLSRQYLNKDHMDRKLAEMRESHEFKEFAQSIKEGLINPLLVTARGGGAGPLKYELVAGFRRYEAAKALGWKDVPCRIIATDPMQADRLNIIENLERKDVTTFGLASAAMLFYRKHKLDSAEVGKYLGKSKEYIRGLVMYREKLSPLILQAWADRDDKTNKGELRFPSINRATTVPNLAAYAALPGGHKEQEANFKMQVLIAEGNTPEEAKKIVEEGGFSFEDDEVKPRGTKGKGKSVKVEMLRSLKKSLIGLELPQSDGQLRDACVALLNFVIPSNRQTKTIKVGKVTLWDPAAEDVDDPDEDDDK